MNDNLSERIIQYRRFIHQNAELSMKEFKTSQYIKDILQSEGFEEIHTLAQTGIVAVLREVFDFKKNKIYKADIDALAVNEDTNLDFKSVNQGIHHACGHDGHAAILLGVAIDTINKVKGGLKLQKGIKFCFQPGEEGQNGARQIIQDNQNYDLLESSPKVENCFALHITSYLPVGFVAYKTGPITAHACQFTIHIQGKGGHVMDQTETIDAVLIMAHLIQEIYNFKKLFKRKGAISIGQAQGGQAYNAIVEQAILKGTFRIIDKEDLPTFLTAFENLKLETEAKFKCTIQNELNTDRYYQAENHQSLEEFMSKLLKDVAGEKQYVYIPEATLGGEDFSEFSMRVPSAYFGLGASITPQKLSNTHHSPQFDFDEKCLDIGLKVWQKLIETRCIAQ